MKPVLCQECEHMGEKCTIEETYGIGQLKCCPFIKSPVLNEYGWLMNPPFTEKYELLDGHVLLIPEKNGKLWVMNWIIFKKGSGSCGKTGPDLYMFSYKKALKDVLPHDRLSGIDVQVIKEISEDKFDNRRIFLSAYDSPEELIEEIPEEYIVKEIVTGTIGDQLDLF